MFCIICGKEINNSAKFCSFCGHVVVKNDFDESNQPLKDMVKNKLASEYNAGNNAKIPYTTNSVAQKDNNINKQKNIGTIIKYIFIIGLVILGVYNSMDDEVKQKNDNTINSYDKGVTSAEDALNELDKGAKASNLNETKIELLKNQGYILSSDSKNEEAIAKFTEALSLAEDQSYDYYLISGELAALNGKTNISVFNFNKALDIDPKGFQALQSLGVLYMGLDEETKSFTDYKKSLEFTKKAYEINQQEGAKENMALAYYYLEDYNNSLTLFLETNSVTNKPNNYYWIGANYLSKGDFASARINFQKAVNLGVKVEPEVIEFINSNKY